MRISDWSSDVCSSDLGLPLPRRPGQLRCVRGSRALPAAGQIPIIATSGRFFTGVPGGRLPADDTHLVRSHCAGANADSHSRRSKVGRKHPQRSEEHTSELQSLMRISYAVFCLKKKTRQTLPLSTDEHGTYLQTT